MTPLLCPMCLCSHTARFARSCQCDTWIHTLGCDKGDSSHGLPKGFGYCSDRCAAPPRPIVHGESARHAAFRAQLARESAAGVVPLGGGMTLASLHDEEWTERMEREFQARCNCLAHRLHYAAADYSRLPGNSRRRIWRDNLGLMVGVICGGSEEFRGELMDEDLERVFFRGPKCVPFVEWANTGAFDDALLVTIPVCDAVENEWTRKTARAHGAT